MEYHLKNGSLNFRRLQLKIALKWSRKELSYKMLEEIYVKEIGNFLANIYVQYYDPT